MKKNNIKNIGDRVDKVSIDYINRSLMEKMMRTGCPNCGSIAIHGCLGPKRFRDRKFT